MPTYGHCPRSIPPPQSSRQQYKERRTIHHLAWHPERSERPAPPLVILSEAKDHFLLAKPNNKFSSTGVQRETHRKTLRQFNHHPLCRKSLATSSRTAIMRSAPVHGMLISGAALKIKVSRVSITLFLLFSLVLPLAAAEQPAARPVADWIASGVIYEINPRTFSATGNFHGIEAKLDDLNDLGVTILWLMPIHPLGQIKKKGTIGSAYAVQDYYGINPSYGTKEDFKHLVADAHKRGLKIIIDIVANHTAWDSVLMRTSRVLQEGRQGKCHFARS